MIAHRVAAPVLERAPAHGVVAGVVRTAAYLELDGFVVAVTARGVPLMPNGVALTEVPASPRAEWRAADAVDPAPLPPRSGRGGDVGWPVVGTAVQLSASGLRGAGWSVAWPAAEPPVWDPSVPRAAAPAPNGAARRRGEAILGGRVPEELLGVEIAGSEGANALLRALATGEPPDAHALLGLGSGLTPEGDDLLAGAAAAVAALEPWSADRRAGWLAAAAPPDAAARTTKLSATLLALAARGQAIEPVHALLDLGHDRWEPALARLERLGHSTGRCYAAAIGAAAVLACGP
jgi:hypothetical protein